MYAVTYSRDEYDQMRANRDFWMNFQAGESRRYREQLQTQRERYADLARCHTAAMQTINTYIKIHWDFYRLWRRRRDLVRKIEERLILKMLFTIRRAGRGRPCRASS